MYTKKICHIKVLLNFPYFVDTTERGDGGWKQAQRQGENRVTLRISLLCDTRFHFGFPWILGLRVGHRQRERERESCCTDTFWWWFRELFLGTESQTEGRNHKHDKQPQTIACPLKHDENGRSSNAWQLETGFIKCLLFFFLDWFLFSAAPTCFVCLLLQAGQMP